MREIRTEVAIAAPLEAVWSVVSDFGAYAEWNPFLPAFEGRPIANTNGRLTAAIPGSKPRTTPVTILEADAPRRLAWRGQLLGSWLFSGTHFLELTPSDGGTRVVNREEFRGLLAPLLLRQLGRGLPAGYEAMNAALKARVERAGRA
ncbi:MAG: SRPBCC domain-containing protein [Dehalococcoidia bacterium]